jgi:hypothetical protein
MICSNICVADSTTLAAAPDSGGAGAMPSAAPAPAPAPAAMMVQPAAQTPAN